MKVEGAEVDEQPELVAVRHDAKRAAIHVAAIDQFTERGIARTSMANIAEAAEMSRPALYQYFNDKDDIFASAFVALFEEHVEAALAALHQPGSTYDQVDGMLQRFEGDLWERMAATTHSDEILSAKNEEVTAAVVTVVERLSIGLASYLEEVADPETQAEWVDVLRLSPKGFKSDQPSVQVYRQRLSTLARGVAADIDAQVV